MDSLVFPFSDCSLPSISGNTGTKVTWYSVLGSRFFRTVEVVVPDTWSWLRRKEAALNSVNSWNSESC